MTTNDTLDEWTKSRAHRLPNFAEVLARKTSPPVDLFMFYLFLQREGAEDVLDFWLDVQQHENLCRAYFKDVRKSGKSIRDEWPQFWDYARRRGSIYGTVVGVNPTFSKQSHDEEKWPPRDRDNRPGSGGGGGSKSPEDGRPSTSMGADEKYTPGHRSPFSTLGGRLSLGPKRASRAPTIIPRSTAITKLDLIASAERIYFRYLSPPPMAGEQSHEVYLPPSLRIHTFPLSSTHLPEPTSPDYEQNSESLAQIPDMFHAQKEYCFRAMEQDAFPRFLRAKAFGNLTPVSGLVRLVLGLVILWAGLSAAFSLVFLDITPKSKRFFLFIPFTLAILLLVSHQYSLDPILVLFRQSEATPFRTLRIKEPYVNKLLTTRAVWVIGVVLALDAALTLIFWAVPGHRL